jgi:hypothetical protein
VDQINTYTVLTGEPPVVRPGRIERARAAAPGDPARFSRFVLGLVALLYVGTCFAPVIFDDNEGLYASAVREMHQSGDWLLPTMNGFPRVQKPPLVYWTMLVSTLLFGENEFTLRLRQCAGDGGLDRGHVADYSQARGRAFRPRLGAGSGFDAGRLNF